MGSSWQLSWHASSAILAQGRRSLQAVKIFESFFVYESMNRNLLVLLLESLAFQLSALHVAEVSRARCVEIPESCADGINEMHTIIKEDAREFARQYTLKPGEFLRFEIQVKTESHTLCEIRQKADLDASESCKTLLTAVKAYRTLLCEREPRGRYAQVICFVHLVSGSPLCFQKGMIQKAR